MKSGKIMMVMMLAAAVSLVAGCRGTLPAVEVDFTPFLKKLLEHLGVPWVGIYHNGECYHTNGEVCIPCEGGEAVACSDLPPFFLPLANSPDPPYFIPDFVVPGDDVHGIGSTDLLDQFHALTGGLNGVEYQFVRGWNGWQEGQKIENLPVEINRVPGEDGSDLLDVSFLWRADWAHPGSVADLPPSVRLFMYIDGNVDDADPRDLMLVRMTGRMEDVRETLAPLGAADLRIGHGWGASF